MNGFDIIYKPHFAVKSNLFVKPTTNLLPFQFPIFPQQLPKLLNQIDYQYKQLILKPLVLIPVIFVIAKLSNQRHYLSVLVD